MPVSVVDGVPVSDGVVPDPVEPDRVYVAENQYPVTGANGRISAVDLRTGTVEAQRPLPDSSLLRRPEQLALDRERGALLAAVVQIRADDDVGIAITVYVSSRAYRVAEPGIGLVALGRPGCGCVQARR